jgi:tetratricopeptide (TPR) repeat protein
MTVSRYILSAALVFSAQIGFASSLLEQADQAYAQRDYNDQGVKMVEQAIELYEQAMGEATDELDRLLILKQQATAYYFLGSSLSTTNTKKAAHETAMALAEQSMDILGVDGKKAHQLTHSQVNDIMNKLSDDQQLLLAEAMYAKGISLAQWGNLSGIASSIGRLPEVLGLMDRIEMLDKSHINQYGPYRTIGRINFVLPSLFGGDLAKSEEYLNQAYRLTLADGQRYSTNGYNNLYLAETLHKRGKETQAKRLLETFLNADFSTLAEGNEPENREALRVAQDLFESWN